MPRWVPTGRPNSFVPLEDLIGANLGLLVPGLTVSQWHTFRITRYSDLDLGQTEEPEDLLATIEEQLFQRRFGEVVRLEVHRDMPESMRELLLEELRASEAPEMAPLSSARWSCTVSTSSNVGDLMALAATDLPEHQDPSAHRGRAGRAP